MPKRQCTYKNDYSKEWDFIKKGRYETEVECTLCHSYLSIGHGGRADITDHLKSKKHKLKISAAGSSKKLSLFL